MLKWGWYVISKKSKNVQMRMVNLGKRVDSQGSNVKINYYIHFALKKDSNYCNKQISILFYVRETIG